MSRDTWILMMFMTGLAIVMMIGIASMLDKPIIIYDCHIHPEPNQVILKE